MVRRGIGRGGDRERRGIEREVARDSEVIQMHRTWLLTRDWYLC